jgi:hypothetical protein
LADDRYEHRNSIRRFVGIQRRLKRTPDVPTCRSGRGGSRSDANNPVVAFWVACMLRHLGLRCSVAPEAVAAAAAHSGHDGCVTREREKLLDGIHENRAIAGWVVAIWVLALVGYVGWVMFRYTMRGDLNCHVPGSDSNYGESSWGWLPPGETCTYRNYPDVATTRPSWVIPAFLSALPLVVAALWGFSEVRNRKRLRNVT